MTRIILLLLIQHALLSLACAQPKVIPLYNGNIPNSRPTPAGFKEQVDSDGFITKISVPTLTVFFPSRELANGTAVIIAPSGGYEVWVDEGEPVAKAFNKIGVTAFVLKYRLPSDEIMVDKTIAPLQDAQTALMMVRKNAVEWNINPNKVGFVGISAGGHLASTAGTHFKTSFIGNTNINLKPDFLILLYPVISLDKAMASGTRENLLGAKPVEEKINFFSTDKHVTPETPPTWLIHAADDRHISVRHSLMFYDALLKAGVKGELHILPTGGHGFALEHPTRGEKWMQWCEDWLREGGFLK